MTTTDQRVTPHATPTATTTAPTLMAALHDDGLADLTRLHLMCLLDTTHWCQFSYLRDALGLSDDRLKRHFHILRSHGYAGTARDKTGVGWAYLTPLGAAGRDAQFAALRDVPPAARDHLTAARASRPDWFTPTRSP
jgi:hypothetical protein